MSQSRVIPIEIDPVRIKTTDGKERLFLLSAGGMNRIKTRYNVKTLQEMLTLQEEAIVPILYEALLDKGSPAMTEEQFADMLPYNPKVLLEAFAVLMGVSLPEPSPNPTLAAPDKKPVSPLPN